MSVAWFQLRKREAARLSCLKFALSGRQQCLQDEPGPIGPAPVWSADDVARSYLRDRNSVGRPSEQSDQEGRVVEQNIPLECAGPRPFVYG